MKKLKQKRARKILFLAIAILGLVFSINMLVAPTTTAVGGVTTAIVIGGITLSEPEEKAYNAMMESVEKTIEKHDKGYVTKDEAKTAIDEALKEYLKSDAKIDIKNIEGLQDQLDRLGIEVNAVKENVKVVDNKKVDPIGVALQKNMPEIIKAFNNKGNFTLTGTIVNKDDVLPASITNDPTQFLLNEIGQVPTMKTIMTSLFRSVQWPKGVGRTLPYIYQDVSNITRASAQRDVGGAAAESKIEWLTGHIHLTSLSDIIPVPLEMLDNWAWMRDEINNFLLNNMALKLDYQLINGSGAGTPLQLAGVQTSAVAWTVADWTTAGGALISEACLADLIRVMGIYIGANTKYTPDFCLINPFDSGTIDQAKDIMGNYIRVPFCTYGTDGILKVGTITVIPTANIAADTMVIGDSKLITRYYGDTVSLTVGYNESGDFAKRMPSILANEEDALLIKTSDLGSAYPGVIKVASIATEVNALKL
jgi:HK97 family phage major capsid protein